MSPGRLFLMLGRALASLLIMGCGAQQFSPASRELTKPLQTAVSAKKPEWLDATEQKIIAQRDAGNVSDAEFRALDTVIQQARSGDWDGAHRAIVALIDGQRATPADLAKLEEGKRNRVREEHAKQANQSRK